MSRISVTDRPSRISLRAWTFGHPWRSASALFVTSKSLSNAFAELPRPPHVLVAKGKNPNPFSSHGGLQLAGFGPVAMPSRCLRLERVLRKACRVAADKVYSHMLAP